MSKKVQNDLDVTLNLLNLCKQKELELFLKQCVCFFATALHQFSLHQQTSFNLDVLKQLLQAYHNKHQKFIRFAEKLLNELKDTNLMDSGFNIALIGKMKAAEKFFEKADRLQSGQVTMQDTIELVRQYFQTASASLTNCIDVVIDIYRIMKLFLIRVLGQSEELAGSYLQVQENILYLQKSSEKISAMRYLIAKANIDVSNDGILIKFMLLLKQYILPIQSLSISIAY